MPENDVANRHVWVTKTGRGYQHWGKDHAAGGGRREVGEAGEADYHMGQASLGTGTNIENSFTSFTSFTQQEQTGPLRPSIEG